MNTPLNKQTMPALFLLILGLPFLTLAGEPSDQIKQTTDKILAIVQDPALKGPDKDAERKRQMRKSVDDRFDWAAMARSAMGKYWRTLSEVQRTEFTGLFSELIEKTYMNKVESYSGEKIQYKGDKVDGAYGVADVMIVTLRDTQIPVSYRVLKKDAEWLVYDVSIEGVSLVNNYRSQIGAILNSSSYDKLILKIRAKIAAVPTEEANDNAGSKTGSKKEDSVL